MRLHSITINSIIKEFVLNFSPLWIQECVIFSKWLAFLLLMRFSEPLTACLILLFLLNSFSFSQALLVILLSSGYFSTNR